MSPPRKIALVDANSFYCSAEKVFRPDLAKVPVVVLSNNDGCVIARDAMSKALGIPMGQPWFQLKADIKRYRWPVVAFSSNYTLYGDLSARFMSVLGQFVAPEDLEQYSIDECFLDFSRYRIDGAETGREIRQRVLQWTGLPVCVGIGATKTLAKLANNVAKKRQEWSGVCDLSVLPDLELDSLLAGFDVGDVWGIGRRLADSLRRGGIRTAADLRQADPRQIRQRFNVVVEKTVSELQGISCLPWDEVPPAKKQIIASRSFGAPLFTVSELSEPIHLHACRAAEKLRQQGSVAGRVGEWIRTNHFREQDDQYSPSHSVQLPEPTADSAAIASWAMRILRGIHRGGYRYVKAGVMLDDIGPADSVQRSLFNATPPQQRAGRDRLMQLMDRANSRWGRGTIGVGAAGVREERPWTMQRDMISPPYSTRWEHVRTCS